MERYDLIEQKLFTIRDYIRWGTSQFLKAKLHFGHGSDNAWDEACYLVLHTLHLPWDSDPAVLDARLTSPECREIIDVIKKRVMARVPAAYITGEAWFSGLRFKVDERVLVPRSPLAELIARDFQPWLSVEPRRILDLCTGSGCIGIACALAFVNALVDLTDISAEALSVARENIALHNLQTRISCYQGDMFAGIEAGAYDLIVANPPYVNADDLASMPAEYHAEPAIGLGSGDDGLAFTRRLLREAADRLNTNGILVVEVGNSYVELERVFPDVPFTWVDLEHGGHGIFVITEAQLREHRAVFE